MILKQVSTTSATKQRSCRRSSSEIHESIKFHFFTQILAKVVRRGWTMWTTLTRSCNIKKNNEKSEFSSENFYLRNLQLQPRSNDLPPSYLVLIHEFMKFNIFVHISGPWRSTDSVLVSKWSLSKWSTTSATKQRSCRRSSSEIHESIKFHFFTQILAKVVRRGWQCGRRWLGAAT